MSARVNLGKAAPELYQAVSSLDKLASQATKSAGPRRRVLSSLEVARVTN